MAYKEIGKRIYYKKDTGEIVFESFDRAGSIVEDNGIEWDWTETSLSKYSDEKGNISHIQFEYEEIYKQMDEFKKEFTKEDGEHLTEEELEKKGVTYDSVDPETEKVIFKLYDIPEPEPDPAIEIEKNNAEEIAALKEELRRKDEEHKKEIVAITKAQAELYMKTEQEKIKSFKSQAELYMKTEKDKIENSKAIQELYTMLMPNTDETE